MILDVSVTEYRHTITTQDVGLARDRQTISILRKTHAPAWFTNPVRSQLTADFTAPPGFQWYVDKYSEVTTQEPWNDIQLYFRRASRLQSSQPQQSMLYFPLRSQPLLNIAAMASAAEAIAGWYCETYYNWGLVARPLRVTPDMIFYDNASSRLALVEVKSTSNMGNPTSKLTTEMINLFKVLAPTKLLHPSRFIAALIMIQVVSATEVHLTSLVLEEP